VTNAERCEIFAFIPGSQAGNRSVAFVLPDLFSNPENLTIRETNRGDCSQLKKDECDEEKTQEKIRSRVFRLLLFS
jgi:hypothetical protein